MATKIFVFSLFIMFIYSFYFSILKFILKKKNKKISEIKTFFIVLKKSIYYFVVVSVVESHKTLKKKICILRRKKIMYPKIKWKLKPTKEREKIFKG